MEEMSDVPWNLKLSFPNVPQIHAQIYAIVWDDFNKAPCLSCQAKIQANRRLWVRCVIRCQFQVTVSSFAKYQWRYFLRCCKIEANCMGCNFQNCCLIICKPKIRASVCSRIFCKMSAPKYCSSVCQLSVKIFCKMSIPN
jgi:hypothetical protein